MDKPLKESLGSGLLSAPRAGWRLVLTTWSYWLATTRIYRGGNLGRDAGRLDPTPPPRLHTH